MFGLKSGGAASCKEGRTQPQQAFVPRISYSYVPPTTGRNEEHTIDKLLKAKEKSSHWASHTDQPNEYLVCSSFYTGV